MSKSLWVDILCVESMLAAWNICRKESIGKICYLNRARGVSDSSIRLWERIIKKPVECVDWISASEEKIEGTTLFELIYLELVRSLDQLVEHQGIVQEIEKICQTRRFNPVKLREHLRESAVPHIFKPVEMLFFAKKISGDANSFFLVRRTCFWELLREILGKEKAYFYTAWISHRWGLNNRPQFHWEPLRNKEYVFDRFHFLMRGVIYWLAMGINSFLAGRIGKAGSETGSRIGIDCIQSKIRLDRINDLYWLPESGIDPKTVYGIEYEDYDEESVANLNSLGVRRCYYSRNPLKILRRMLSERSKFCGLIAVRFQDWLKVWASPFQFLSLLGKWDIQRWVKYEEINFRLRVTFWESVYRQLGIRMLWSMYDYDQDKLAKAQALENIDGLFMGSHWTNYQMVAAANERKVYDVFFPWGEHFVQNIDTRYPFIAVFPAGYPLDYYFEAKKAGAAELRAKYPGKFILSYHDNVCSNDFTYSLETEKRLYRMLFLLLQKYDQLVVFLKPKRIDIFEQSRKDFSEIDAYIKQERMEVFTGETPRTRFAPAEIGMASDLAVGLGISTPAAECFFAGTMSFHADFPGFQDNPFVKNGLNKFVYCDVESLKQAIEDRIEGRDQKSCLDYRAEHEPLDPFQDGKAYVRTGFLINRLQQAFIAGLDRQTALEKAKGDYYRYLSFQGMSAAGENQLAGLSDPGERKIGARLE